MPAGHAPQAQRLRAASQAKADFKYAQLASLAQPKPAITAGIAVSQGSPMTSPVRWLGPNSTT